MKQFGSRLNLPSAPGAGESWVGDYTAASEKEHSYESTGAVKSESTTGDHSEFVIEAFGESVGEFGFDVGEDAVFVFSDGSCCLHERCESGARGPGKPAIQFFLGIGDARFFEDGGKGFLEQVGAVERSVVFLDGAEFVPFFRGEIPRVFEQCETGLLDRSGLFGIVELLEATDHSSSHFVDIFGSEFEYVEEVENDLRLWCFVPDGLDVTAGHVDGDGFYFCQAFRTEFIEECVESIRALSLSSPNDTFADVVYNGGDVAVPFSVAEFVDADLFQIIESLGVELIVDDSFDDVSDGTPGNTHNPGDVGFVGNLSEIRRHLLEGSSEATICPCPRNKLDTDVAVRAFYSSRRVFKNNPGYTDAEVYPSHGSVAMIVAWPDLLTFRTTRVSPGWFDSDDKTISIKIDTFDEKTGNPDKFSDKLVGAHCFLPGFGGFCRHPKTRKTMRVSIYWHCLGRNLGGKRPERPRGVISYPLSMQESHK